MTNINYLRKIEKKIEENANMNYRSSDGRKIHEITESKLNEIISDCESISMRELNGEKIITMNNTYYQIFVKVVAGRGRPRKTTTARDQRINEIWANILKEINK